MFKTPVEYYGLLKKTHMFSNGWLCIPGIHYNTSKQFKGCDALKQYRLEKN